MTTPNRFGRVETRTRDDLKYRITHPALPSGQFIVEVILRVEGGVRFLCESWGTRPTELLMTHRCVQYGEFSRRPYTPAQLPDDSTQECVLALYYDYCRRSNLDASQLMAKAYPGGESAEDWSALRWRRILESAEWHQTRFPETWTTAAVLGLLLSLKGQKRLHLATTLAETIGLRNIPRILLTEEPGS
jgi:hypothetical protein